MKNFSCPICGCELSEIANSLRCDNNHNFDKAKSGYVNLLLSQQSGAKHHGDDKLMVLSRRDFLEKGYYDHLLSGVCDSVLQNAHNHCIILDAGCGEGWYSSAIFQALIQNHISSSFFGVDISKSALTYAAKRNKDLRLAVASVSKLPVANDFCDIILSIFAPCAAEEFLRILKVGGKFIRVIPLEKHLWSLKKALYEIPYKNDSYDLNIDGFKLLEEKKICKVIHLSCNEDILNLFKMTPYYYKTGIDDQKKLDVLNALDTETEFSVLVYEKNAI